MENKEVIIEYLKLLLKRTRAGSDLKDLIYIKHGIANDETVLIKFDDGYGIFCNIAGDSGIAIIQDVIKTLLDDKRINGDQIEQFMKVIGGSV